jgi:hypothetical protein
VMVSEHRRLKVEVTVVVARSRNDRRLLVPVVSLRQMEQATRGLCMRAGRRLASRLEALARR